MINIEEEYIGLLSGVFHGGQDKEDRTGTGTKSVFGRMLRHDMRAGFPLLTTKKIYYNNALAEILWIIRGRTDLHYLHSNGVKYWDADYKRSGRSDGTLALYTVISGVIFVVLISLNPLLGSLIKIQRRGDLWYRRGTQLICLIWYCLLVTTVFNYIVMVST